MRILRVLGLVGMALVLGLGIALVVDRSVEAGYQEVASDINASYLFTPDNNTLVYVDSAVSPVASYQLFAVSPTSPHPIQLTYETDFTDLVDFEITPDGSAVVYITGNYAGEPLQSLKQVPINGGASHTIISSPNGISRVGFIGNDNLLSPDGNHAFYRSNTALGGDAIYTIPLAGGAPVLLLEKEHPEHVRDIRFSPDSQWVVIGVDLSAPLMVGFSEYIVPITGGTPVFVGAGAKPENSYGFTADSQTYLFTTQISYSPDLFRLYAMRPDGTGLTQIGVDSPFISVQTTETDGGILYQQEYSVTTEGRHNEIYSLSALGATPTLLYRDGITTTTTLRATAGEYALLVEHELTEPPFQETFFYSIRTDGSAPGVRLTDDVGREIGSSLYGIDFTPDAQTLVYSPVAQTVNPQYLYAVPLDGSSTPRLLYPTQAVQARHISADGSRVFAVIEKIERQEVVEIGLTSAYTNLLFTTAPRPEVAVWIPETLADQAWVSTYDGSSIIQDLYFMDSALSAVQFPAMGTLLQESDSTFNLPVTLDAAFVMTITAEIEVVGGTATQGTDYTFLPAQVIFASGTTTATAPITILEDAVVEADETIILEIRTITEGVIGTPSTYTITLAENVYRTHAPLILRR